MYIEKEFRPRGNKHKMKSFKTLFQGKVIPLRNHSTITEFILLGWPPLLGSALCAVPWGLLPTLMGNLMTLLVISADSHLYMPLYLFLGQFFLLDICHSLVLVPKLLENHLSEKKAISVAGPCVCHWGHWIPPAPSYGLWPLCCQLPFCYTARWWATNHVWTVLASWDLDCVSYMISCTSPKPKHKITTVN